MTNTLTPSKRRVRDEFFSDAAIVGVETITAISKQQVRVPGDSLRRRQFQVCWLRLRQVRILILHKSHVVAEVSNGVACRKKIEKALYQARKLATECEVDTDSNLSVVVEFRVHDAPVMPGVSAVAKRLFHGRQVHESVQRLWNTFPATLLVRCDESGPPADDDDPSLYGPLQSKTVFQTCLWSSQDPDACDEQTISDAVKLAVNTSKIKDVKGPLLDGLYKAFERGHDLPADAVPDADLDEQD